MTAYEICGLNPPPDKTPVKSYNVLGGWKSEKPGCVFWDTHGLATSSSGMMTVQDCPGLDDTHPVYTFQGACLNAKPTVSNNLCYSNLVNGAIAANGGTISVSYTPGETDYTKTGSIGGQNYWYAKYLIRDSLTTAESNDMARARINGKKWANHKALVLYGDPTMSPYLCQSSPSITALSPGNGEIFQQGTTIDITWKSNFTENIKIELLRGSAVVNVIASDVPNSSPYKWNIPEDVVDDTTYKIRLTKKDDSKITDESDSTFTINTRPSFVTVSVSDVFTLTEYKDEIETKDKGDKAALKLYLIDKLPEGLSFEDKGNGNGIISGKAENAGSYEFTLAVTDGIITDSVKQVFKLQVKKLEKPTVTKEPQDVLVEVGETAVFPLEAEGDLLEYQWQCKKKGNNNFVDIKGQTNQTCVIEDVKPDYDGYLYRCKVFNAAGETISRPAALKVNNVAIKNDFPVKNDTWEKLTLTPNPVEKHQSVCLDFSSIDMIEGTLRVYDAVGDMVYTRSITPTVKSFQWNVCCMQGKRLSPGTYLAAVTLKRKDGTWQKLKTLLGVK